MPGIVTKAAAREERVGRGHKRTLCMIDYLCIMFVLYDYYISIELLSLLSVLSILSIVVVVVVVV